MSTASRSVELYATNEAGADYYYKADDIYDVNNNLNTTEKINKTSTTLSMISPNSLLTNQRISDFDDKGTVVVSPEIAEVQPQYANTQTATTEAKVGVQLTNNYSNSISEVLVLGKIPFEGNSYVIYGGDLNSEFTTQMKNTGIQVPAELQGRVTIYYSENENPSKELSDANNGWKTAENVTDWSKIKTFLIDFEDTEIPTAQKYTFYYTVNIPNGAQFNEVAYSHHGVYFALNTDAGKYRTKTEPNKIGIRIAERFDVRLTKFQKERAN